MSAFRPDVLAGRVALVTGGGTGICKGIARAFVDHGARVCITSRRQEVLDQAAADIGGDVLPMAADVRDPDQLARVVAAAVDRFGKLNTLVNGAAGNFLAPTAALSAKGFRTVIEIDLLGTFHATKAAFDPLRDSGDGCIINISATLHYHGTPLQSHAAAAKAGVDALTRNLAVEWGPFGIRANAIAPGPIGDTEGMRRLAPGDIGAKVERRVPLRRLGRIDDVANAAVFLASPAAAYINGAVLVVDGGDSVAPGLADLLSP
ncbi:MAG: SDR family oxidoreductase [Deltaproteobacteria bacterium]|nr:MAG: SDR family oxidoreductase [Deltaproteobacteria bacterium]